MVTFNKTVASLIMLLFTYLTFSQTYFSERLNVGNKANLSTTLKLYNDSLFIPAQVFETPNSYSSCLLKLTNTGTIITQKRFKPINRSFEAGNDFYIKNNKFYVTSITADFTKLQSGFYVFNESCYTVYTKNYGDTNFYNYGYKIHPFNQTKNKLLLIGETDSTCGIGHPGFYKPVVRVVDTNGILYQTKLFLNSNKYRTLTGSDTTLNKGYIFCGVEQITGANPIGQPFIVKIDSNLNQKWSLYLTDNTSSYYADVLTLKNGKHIVSHNKVDSVGIGNIFWERISLMKLDTNGAVIWQKYYGSKQRDITTTAVKELPNKDLIVTGCRRIAYNPSVSQVMGFLMMTDSIGNLKWWNNYIAITPIKDTIGECYLFDAIQMPDKGFAAVGWAGPSGYFGTKQESWLLRVDSMGCLVPGCNPFGTMVGETEITTANKFYPNPTNGKLIIEVSELSNTSTSSVTKLVITDIVGEEIKNEKIILEKTELNISEISNGIYFLNFYENNKLIVTKKLIKQ